MGMMVLSEKTVSPYHCRCYSVSKWKCSSISFEMFSFKLFLGKINELYFLNFLLGKINELYVLNFLLGKTNELFVCACAHTRKRTFPHVSVLHLLVKL